VTGEEGGWRSAKVSHSHEHRFRESYRHSSISDSETRGNLLPCWATGMGPSRQTPPPTTPLSRATPLVCLNQALIAELERSRWLEGGIHQCIELRHGHRLTQRSRSQLTPHNRLTCSSPYPRRIAEHLLQTEGTLPFLGPKILSLVGPISLTLAS
jgi:hypothetical protein